MTRGHRLPVARLALAVLAWLSSPAVLPSRGGQPWDWPSLEQAETAVLWRGQQSDLELPSLAVEAEDHRQSVAGQFDETPFDETPFDETPFDETPFDETPFDETMPLLGPGDSDSSEGELLEGDFVQSGPDCDGACGGPVLGAGCRRPPKEPPSPRYRLYGRHRGRGDPLIRESWLYRPISAGWSMGYVGGSPPTWDWLAGKQQGFFGAVRLGWDHNYHWGSETRLVFDNMNAQAVQWDLDLLYYPWGDSRWRPYLMVGVGAAKIRFRQGYSPHYDRSLSPHHEETVFALPLAVGLKYRWSDWVAVRLEFGDNILFAEGSGLNVLVNYTVTGGFEFRFGGRRKSYWPWNPGRHYW